MKWEVDKGKGDQERKKEDEGRWGKWRQKKGRNFTRQKYEYFEQVAIGRYTLQAIHVLSSSYLKQSVVSRPEERGCGRRGPGRRGLHNSGTTGRGIWQPHATQQIWVTVVALGDGRSSWVTVVAQWVKAPGIHSYVAGSIPAVTPRNCTNKIEKCSWEHIKNKGKKKFHYGRSSWTKLV